MKTKPKISVVIFDCDGVLFDSRHANILFYNHLLERFGLQPMTDDQVAYVHMHTADEAVDFLFEGTPFLKEAQQYRLKMNYTPFIRSMVMEPGLVDLLKILRPHFKLAIATNRSNTIGEVLRTFGLMEYFDMVVSSLDVNRPKPDPECIKKILERFHAGAQEAVYIGDSEVDAKTAKAAGVMFFAYKNGDLEADYHLESLMEIEGLLCGNT